MPDRTASICLLVRLAFAMALLIAPTFPAFAAGVAILGTILSDNGDNDGFADTNETVTLRLKLQNNTGADLTGLTLQLTVADHELACVTDSTIQVGGLLAGEVRETAQGFEFVVHDADRVGMNLTYSKKDVTAAEEISRLQKRVAKRDMQILDKSAPHTYWPGSNSAYREDHECAEGRVDQEVLGPRAAVFRGAEGIDVADDGPAEPQKEHRHLLSLWVGDGAGVYILGVARTSESRNRGRMGFLVRTPHGKPAASGNLPNDCGRGLKVLSSPEGPGSSPGSGTIWST